jgi:glycerol-3-phosphate acyltransferase PlsY
LLFSLIFLAQSLLRCFQQINFKQDPRQTGSKNLGALNALRMAQKKKEKKLEPCLFYCILFDAGKGVIADFRPKLALATITNPLCLARRNFCYNFNCVNGFRLAFGCWP